MTVFSTPGFNITEFSRYRSVEGQYTDQFIKSSRCVKLGETEKDVSVAVSESFRDRMEVLKEAHAPKEIRGVVVSDPEFAEFIGIFVDSVAKKDSGGKSTDDGNFRLENINSDAPVVNIINAICLEAIRRKASDIHIQGTKKGVSVRLRMDGVLQTVRNLDRSIFENLVSRVKVMAGLTVMESRLCQDGRMAVQAGDKKLDFRVSIVPSVTGQDIVLRLFNSESEALALGQLGFSDENFRKINEALKFPYGMILATGPTGSGKTTTLHAMLREMDLEHLKVVTIEDPVEKVIDGIEQIQVNDEIGLTFEGILRRILRHDPDVIMVGEIRDGETAGLAVRSALPGHLILSTIHTNDSISAVARLRNLGIEPYLIAGTLRASIAQRLVRKLCPECGGKGCASCSSTGFAGRTAVSEVLMVDDAVRGMIERGDSDSEIRRHLAGNGFQTLRDDAARKISAGISSREEMMREGLA